MNLQNPGQSTPLVLKAYRQIAGRSAVYEQHKLPVSIIVILTVRPLNKMFILCCFVHHCQRADNLPVTPCFTVFTGLLLFLQRFSFYTA